MALKNNCYYKEGKGATSTWLLSVDIAGVVDNDENRLNVVAFSQHCGLHQLKRKIAISSIFIIIHGLQQCLPTVAR